MVERQRDFSESAILRAFGDRVRQLRLDRGWNQEQLMERASLDRSYVSQIESGHRNPSLLVIAKIAGAFGVEIGELFRVGGQDAMVR